MIEVSMWGEQPGYGYNQIVGIMSFGLPETPDGVPININLATNLNYYRSPSPVMFKISNGQSFSEDRIITAFGVEFLLPAGQIQTQIQMIVYGGGSFQVFWGFYNPKKHLHYGNVEVEKFLVLPSDNMEFTPGEDLDFYFQCQPNFKIQKLVLNGLEWVPPVGGDATKAQVNWGSFQDDVLLDAYAVSIFEWAKKFRIWGVRPNGEMKVSEWMDVSGGSATLPVYQYQSVILEGENGLALPNGNFNIVSGGVGFTVSVIGDKQYVQGGSSFLPSGGSGNITVNTEIDDDSVPTGDVDTDPPIPLNPQGSDSGLTPGSGVKPVPNGTPLPIPPSLTPGGDVNQVPKDRENIPEKPSGGGSCLDPCMQDQISVLKWIGEVLDRRLGQIYEGMIAGFNGINLRLDRQEQSLAADLEKAAALGDDLDDILENFFGDDSPMAGIESQIKNIGDSLKSTGDDSKGLADIVKENDPVYIAQIEGADLRITGQGVGLGPDF